MPNYEDKCPACGSATIEFEDHEESWWTESMLVLWYCRCSNCGKRFHVKERYSRTYTTLTYVEGEDDA